MPDLPVITSWGQLALLGLGGFLAIRYIAPLLKQNGADHSEWRGRVEQMLISNGQVLQQLAENQESMERVVIEIERRSRDSDIAIRQIGELFAQARHSPPL